MRYIIHTQTPPYIVEDDDEYPYQINDNGTIDIYHHFPPGSPEADANNGGTGYSTHLCTLSPSHWQFITFPEARP